MIILIVFAAIILLNVGWFVVIYIGFIRERTLIKEAWSGIDTQLKRRHDLIPRLVETVKGYMQHERGIARKDLRTPLTEHRSRIDEAKD